MTERWSRHHHRLHQQLLRRPELLPRGARLLLAVSGGQDSMALVGLLRDLQRLHHWTLELWHGDHGWREESGHQAAELQQWAQQQGLPLLLERWSEPQPGEAAARAWRYRCLTDAARARKAGSVVTGHTASDRAETLLLQLARGSHQRGLASLRQQRPLADGIRLVRPLLLFSRADTDGIRRELALPLWHDRSNDDPRFSRNRLRREVLPVLEELHPGAVRRISHLSERLAEEETCLDQLVDLALEPLLMAGAGPEQALQRAALMQQHPANQRRLLLRWLERQGHPGLPSAQLDGLLARLASGRPPGQLPLAGQQCLRWTRSSLVLITT